jgi:hypothetical protein
MLAQDPEKAQRIADRWEKRDAIKCRHATSKLAKSALRKARPIVLAELARKGGQARWKGTTAEQRREAMRELASRKQRAA